MNIITLRWQANGEEHSEEYRTVAEAEKARRWVLELGADWADVAIVVKSKQES